MTESTIQAAQLQQQAGEALRRGDGKTALAALRALQGTPQEPLLLVVQAHLLLGDHAAAEEAADRILALDPRHPAALVYKADCRLQLGDSKAATAFYATALQTPTQSGAMPPALQALLARARSSLDAICGDYEASLRNRLHEAGLEGDRLSPRMSEALEIVSGRKQIYMQQPVSFYFPGLPQIQFYEREQFDWVAGFEAQTDAIRSELLAVLEDEKGFAPYVESDPTRPAKRNAMLGDTRWSAYHLLRGGEPVAGHADRCPRTIQALRSAPIPTISGRSPMALFSMLKPGMHIVPHTGFLNTRLICHLPLLTPPGCRLRVGNEVRTWEAGKMLIFDDSIEHEAWNEGNETRVVLLFEIWRPEIGAADREALTVLYEHIANYSD
jgi:hypothetical protein